MLGVLNEPEKTWVTWQKNKWNVMYQFRGNLGLENTIHLFSYFYSFYIMGY